jgi:D-alanyl-D-alanine carboxypeptidase
VLIAAPGASAAPAAEADRALEHAMRELVAVPGGPPGVAVVVQRGARRSFHAAGTARVGSSARWRPGDHMRLASVSKALSAAAALSLVSRNRLSLSDRVRAWLPWLPAEWEGVTLAEALQHTSGLPDYSGSRPFQEFVGAHLHAYVSPRRLIGFVAGEPLRFSPGRRFEYSNTDNVVVGLIVAAVTGDDYSRQLRRLVYRPLGLTRTSLPVGFRIPRPFVHGYDLSPPQPPADVTTLISMSGAWASGGVQSTAADLNRFVRGDLGARLFSRAVQRRQLRFVAGHSEPPGPGVNAAGLGVFRYRTRCGTVYGHTGNVFGYTQFAAATLGGRRSVTVSVNAQVTPGSKNAQVRAAFGDLRRLYTLGVCAALAGR